MPVGVMLDDNVAYEEMRLLEFVSVADIFGRIRLYIRLCNIRLWLFPLILLDGISLSLRASAKSRAQTDERGNHYVKDCFSLTQSNFTETSLETPASSIVTP